MYERSLEMPAYTVEQADGAIEIRQYPALLVAEATSTGAREAALSAGFGRLADYIFAKRRGPSAAKGGESIAMTAPVLSSADSDAAWRTRFVLPARYSAATAPSPPPGVTIAEVPARRVAALRFAGRASDAALHRREEELRQSLVAAGLSGGDVEYAFYNSPFVPGPLRRNEVLIALR